MQGLVIALQKRHRDVRRRDRPVVQRQTRQHAEEVFGGLSPACFDQRRQQGSHGIQGISTVPLQRRLPRRAAVHAPVQGRKRLPEGCRNPERAGQQRQRQRGRKLRG